MLPPSDSDSDSDSSGDDAPRSQPATAGLLPPSDSDSDSDGEDKPKAEAEGKKKKEPRPLVPDAPRRAKEDELDPEQMREDMEKLELVKKKREMQRLARIAEDGWDRYAPVTDTNRPPDVAPGKQ